MSYQNVEDIYSEHSSESVLRRTHRNPLTKHLTSLVGLFVVLVVCLPLFLNYVSSGVRSVTSDFAEMSEKVSTETKKELSEKIELDLHMSFSNSTTEKLAEKSEAEKKALFKDFQQNHLKEYSNDNEMLSRFEIFKHNLYKIDEMNENQPLAKYHISKFADLTADEFKAYNGLTAEYESKISAISGLSVEKQAQQGFVRFEETKIADAMKNSNLSLPISFDWREYGAVTPVKDQGQCGGCWAFSATGNMEGIWQISTGNSVSLSEQELISCALGAHGCYGGLMNDAFQFVIENGGIETEQKYPYTSGKTVNGETGKCRLGSASQSTVSISGWTMVKVDSVSDLQAALQAHGPISVGINADQLQFYTSGIDICQSDGPVNHAVLLVGFGNENGENFWIIKNSWGTNWGENGYYYISSANGACGVGSVPITSL